MTEIASAGRGHRAWLLAVLLLTATFAFVDRQILSAVAQPIKRSLGISDTELGLLGGLAFGVLNCVISIPIARLAERFNRVLIYAAGVFLWSLATISCGFAGSFGGLLAARIAVGVGEATQPAATSLIADYYPPARRTAVSAILILSVPLGALLGSAGGGWIAQHADWRIAFVAAGAPGLVLSALLALTIREPPRGRHDAPPPTGDAVPPIGAVLRRMVERPSFIHTALGSTLASAGGFGINIFVAPYLYRRFGMSVAEAGLIAGLISAIPGSISMFGGGMLTNWLGSRDARWYALTPAIATLIAGPLYLLSLAQQSGSAFTAGLMVTGIVQYVYLPASLGVYANTMEPRMRATAGAAVTIMTNLVGAGAGPLLVGILSDRFSRRFYPGSFADACTGTRAAETAAAGPCGEAAAHGLQWALMIAAVIYVWAALHYFLAARTVRRDMR